MLILASCSKENILHNEEVSGKVESALTIIASQGGADTRLAFVDEWNLAWTPGDKIIVTEATSPSHYITLALHEDHQTATGTFTTTGETTATELAQIETWKSSNTPLMAYYKNDGLIDNSIEGNLNLLRFYDAGFESLLDHLQVYGGQTSNNNKGHLKVLNHMASKESFILSDETDVLNLKFSQSGAIMEFTLTGLGGKTIKDLSLTADEEVFLAGYHNSDPQKTASVSLPLGESGGGIALGSDEILTAYMIMGPTEATAGKTITLTATASDESIYTATITGGVIEAGKIYSVSKTMMQENNNDYEVVDNTYIVYNAAGLQAWRAAVESNLSLNLKLANDIVLTGEDNWTPVGTPNAERPDHDHYPDLPGMEETPETPNTEYIGTIDGGGYTITGLNVVTQESTYAGFIGALGTGGVVKNMTFVDAKVNSIGYVAVVVATNKGQVENCHITSGDISGKEVTIDYTFYASAAAGIVADNNGVVLGCSNGASVTCNSYLGTGGVVGRNTGIVMGCINSGVIKNTYADGSSSRCGGIVGVHIGTNAISVACGNYGEVSSTMEKQTGGIAGFLNDGAKLIGLWTKATNPEDSKGDMDGVADGIGDMLNGSATACYYFNDFNSVTDEVIATMNSAINSYNEQNTVKCNYKWVAGDSSWPTLVKNE